MPGFNRDELGRFAGATANGGEPNFAGATFEAPSTREALLRGKDTPRRASAPPGRPSMPSFPDDPAHVKVAHDLGASYASGPAGNDFGIRDTLSEVNHGIAAAKSQPPADWAPDLADRLTPEMPRATGLFSGLGVTGAF